MKWQGSTEKTVFIEWAHNATKEDLRDSIIESRYPTTFSGKAKYYGLIAFILILFFGCMVGLAFTTHYYASFRPYVHNQVSMKKHIGEIICRDYGGLLDYDYYEGTIYFQCKNKFISIDEVLSQNPI